MPSHDLRISRSLFDRFCMLLALSSVAFTVHAKKIHATEVTQHQYRLGQINQLNISEPAGSHASHRTTLSWTLESLTWKPQQNRSDVFGNQNVHIKNQLLVSKGIFYPIDLGLAVAQTRLSEDHPYYQIGGYLQWTIFEAFALPALSLRGKRSRLTGPGLQHLDSLGFEIETSWGFRQLSFFAGQQITFHSFSPLDTNDSTPTHSHSYSSSNELGLASQFTSYDGHWGAHFQIVPGVLSLAIDLTRKSQTRHFRGKISYEF